MLVYRRVSNSCKWVSAKNFLKIFWWLFQEDSLGSYFLLGLFQFFEHIASEIPAMTDRPLVFLTLKSQYFRHVRSRRNCFHLRTIECIYIYIILYSIHVLLYYTDACSWLYALCSFPWLLPRIQIKALFSRYTLTPWFWRDVCLFPKVWQWQYIAFLSGIAFWLLEEQHPYVCYLCLEIDCSHRVHILTFPSRFISIGVVKASEWPQKTSQNSSGDQTLAWQKLFLSLPKTQFDKKKSMKYRSLKHDLLHPIPDKR